MDRSEDNFGDKNTETFNSQEYDLSQTITVPKAGIYEVSVQAYYRDGNREPHATSVANSETLHQPAVLYAGAEEEPLMYIHAEADKAPGEGTSTVAGEFPDNMMQASHFFQNGLYWNRVRVEVSDDNANLTIGIRKTGTDHRDDNWIVADNFRIAYLGTAALGGDVNNDGNVTIADVTALVNLILGKDDSGYNRTAADVNNDGSITIADVTALVNLILGKN